MYSGVTSAFKVAEGKYLLVWLDTQAGVSAISLMTFCRTA